MLRHPDPLPTPDPCWDGIKSETGLTSRGYIVERKAVKLSKNCTLSSLLSKQSGYKYGIWGEMGGKSRIRHRPLGIPRSFNFENTATTWFCTSAYILPWERNSLLPEAAHSIAAPYLHIPKSLPYVLCTPYPWHVTGTLWSICVLTCNH